MLDLNRKKNAIECGMSFVGLTDLNSLTLMAVFIDELFKGVEPGGLIEFGSYHGRVGGFLGSLMRPEDTLTLLDQNDNLLDHQRLQNAGIKYTYHNAWSEKWLETMPINSRFILSHHDASHFFDNVHEEISKINSFMDRNGLIILDDFTDSFSQVRAAYYHLRYACNLDWELLLIGFSKAYLVHNSRFAHWEEFILEKLQNELKNMDLPSVLARTDNHKLSRNFHINKKYNPEEADLLGVDWWGDKFYHPS
jgi:hypothetical protein